MQSLLLTILIILQIIVMVYILYTSHKRYQYDKKFWEKQDEISEEFLKSARTMNDTEHNRCECEADESEE